MTPSKQIDTYISNQPEWQGKILSTLRKTILAANSGIEETWKWDVPVFVYKKMLCAISAHREHVKINFFQGAELPDQSHFNNGFTSKKHRAIDYGEGDSVDTEVIKELVQDSVEYNQKK